MNISITESQLIEYNKLGLVPGPQESETEFLNRVLYCLSLQKTLSKELGSDLPFIQESPQEQEVLIPAFEAIAFNGKRCHDTIWLYKCPEIAISVQPEREANL